MRVSDFIVARLAFLGVDTSFLVTGGGAMYLNDAIGESKQLQKIYCHHEQAASMAAEAYARVARKPALLNVTTGPGGINALNGVFGAYTDSIMMIIISGQVKRETMRSFNQVPGLRQLGDQEVDIISMAKPITKWAYLLKTPEEVADAVDKLFIEAVTGRPGPAWLDIPVDLQGAILSKDFESLIKKPLQVTAQKPEEQKQDLMLEVIKQISNSKRPVILAGSGIRIAGMNKNLVNLAETLGVPVVTAWAHDIFPNDHRLFAGRPGTIGTRAGNFVVQNSDLVIVLGSRLNIRQVSYNWKSFARNANIIWVEIDAAEFKKQYLEINNYINADLKIFIPAIISTAKKTNWKPIHDAWVSWCSDINKRYTPKPIDYPVSKNAINVYHFIDELFNHLDSNDIIVCGNATATIVPFQIGKLKNGMQLISNSGSASMGYDIPAALGVAIANPNTRIICLAGDGSSMMNIQELQTISGLNLNILIFILNNDGYLSIKQTQKNFFNREAGSSPKSGLTFPNFKKIGQALGLKGTNISKYNWRTKLRKCLQLQGPYLFNVELDVNQEFEPRLKSKMVEGKISTPELDDMYPFLSSEELDFVRSSSLKI